MSEDASPFFDDYRSEHPARLPDLSNMANDDEISDLRRMPDVFSLSSEPAGFFLVGSPGDIATKCLWLVGVDDVVFAQEYGASGVSTSRGRLAHTNLSGGVEAHSGGELWWENSSRLWINGASSRYQPRSAAELQSVVDSFRRSGYQVVSFGWDEGMASPSRFFRDDGDGGVS